MISVDRESQQTKVRDLLDNVPDLIDEMIHNEELSRATIQITPQRLTALKDFSSVVGLVINFLFLYYSKHKYHYKYLDIPDWTVDAVEILGYIQGSSSLILIFFFAINKLNLITKKKWREYISENETRDPPYELIPNDERMEIQEMSYEMTHLILMLKGPDAPEFNIDKDAPRDFGNWFTASEYYLLQCYFFI